MIFPTKLCMLLCAVLVTPGLTTNDLEEGPPIVETSYNVMGAAGETSESIGRQQRILEEEEAVDLEKYSKDEGHLQKREYVDEGHGKNDEFSLRSYVSKCIDDIKKARKRNISPDDLPCVRQLFTQKQSRTLERRGVLIKEEVNGKIKHWPGNKIPYVMKGFTEDEVIDRIQAHKHIEYWSCIRFVQKTNEANWINHVDNGGCQASIGLIDNGKEQNVSCCGGEQCVHELMHALGLHHEHIHPGILDVTRINYDTMDKSSWEAWTPLLDNPQNYYTDPYDLGTILHYKPWHATNSHYWSLTVLDPDQQYLLYDSDHLHFLAFKTLSKMFKCGEEHCPNVKCNYGGYPTMINDRCTCRCPEGRDPARSCDTRYIGAQHIPSAWPAAAVAVLGSSHGSTCPSGFQKSDISLDAPLKGTSDEFSVSINGDSGSVDLTFCAKEQTSEAGMAKWGAGKYCLFRVGNTCPEGFKPGSMTFNSKTVPLRSGSPVPSYTVSGSGVKFHFCCRRDALHQDSLELPRSSSFTLLQYNGDCQHVVDMVSFKQEVTLDVTSTWRKEGLVPDHFKYWEVVRLRLCYYAAVERGKGKNVFLRDSNPIKVVQSPSYPSSYDDGAVFYYIIKSPENTKIKLSFDDFNVEPSADGTRCMDYMEIYQYIPGQEGAKYCGNTLAKTFISETNQLNMKFVNALTFNNAETWKFKFTVELITDSDYCYIGKGENYRGEVSVTRHFETCLPWALVKDKCLKHPFDQMYFDSGLESNYCRNPGHGTRPWCYTALDGCRRDYCDVCKLEKCYDIEAKCTEIIQTNQDFCTSDPESARVCRKSCNYCGSTVPVPKVTEHQCGAPPSFPDATANSQSNSFEVGETVKFNCNHGLGSKSRVCTIYGWTGGNYVCGQCPTDWVPHGDFCYKFVKKNVKLDQAIQHCVNESATLVSITNQEEQNFVQKLRGAPYSFWIGITPCVNYECSAESDGEQRTWLDHTPFQWTNFDPTWNKNYKQFLMTNSGMWGSYWDPAKVLPYMCKMPLPTQPQSCMDNIPSCKELLTWSPTACFKNPDFRRYQCARSCGFCKDTDDTAIENRCYQGQPRPVNAERVIHNTAEGTKRERVGSYYQYKCNDGYELYSGDLYRACLNDGKLTGEAPICKATNEVSSCCNILEMIPRGSINSQQGVMNIMDNDVMRAHKSGILHRIIFYSEAVAKVTFLVLRRKSGNVFTLVNSVDVMSGFRRVIHKDVSGYGIAIKVGDYLGFFYPDQKPNVITYDLCTADEDRKLHDGFMKTAFMYNNKVIHDADYTFTYDPRGTSCRIHSIKMCII